MTPIPRLQSLVVLVVLAFAAAIPRSARADDEADERAAFAKAQAAYEKGDYANAAKWCESALPLAVRVFGPNDYNTAVVLGDLGLAYEGTGEFSKAEQVDRRALNIKEAARGPNDLGAADSLMSLGFDYYAMGEFAKAEPLWLRALKIREATLGPNHLDVAASLEKLGILYRDTVEYGKAEPLLQRSLRVREASLGANDPSVAQSLWHIGLLFQDRGDYATAERLFLGSIKIYEATKGPEGPDLAQSLNSLGALYVDMGEFAKAEPLLTRSRSIFEVKLGPNNPNLAASLGNLGNLYLAIGEYAKAEPFFQRSLKIKEEKLGPDSPRVANDLNSLGILYRATGEYAKAEPLLQRSLKIREASLGLNHTDVAMTLNNLGSLYESTGEYAKAEPFYLRAIKIYGSQQSDPIGLAFSLNNLAKLYTDMGERAKAEPLYVRCLKILETTCSSDHPDVALGLNNLANLHAATERWGDAVRDIDRERRIVRRHVARILPILSDREQLIFLKTQDEGQFHVALSLALHERQDAAIVSRSAGWILNGKGVAQESLAERALFARDSADPALAGIVQQLLSVRAQLASLSLAAPKPSQEVARQQQLDQLNQQEQELSRRLGQATGRNTTDDPWVEPAAVRKALPRDAVLIEIVRFWVRDFQAKGKDAENWFAPHYTAWIIPADGQGEIKIVDLGDADRIDVAVKAARAALETAPKVIKDKGEADAEDQLRQPMQALAKLVLEPLVAQVGNAQKLIISPDASLWLVPWGALPIGDSQYAIEKYQISYVISGRDLVNQASSRQPKPTAPILFADPDYDLSPADATANTQAVLRRPAPRDQIAFSRGSGSFIGLQRAPRLPGTAAEAEAIKPKLRDFAKTEPIPYMQEYALEGVFKALHHPRVLVLSTHGFFLPDQEAKRDDRVLAGGEHRAAALSTEGKPLENPLLRCGLLLAGCNQRTDATIATGDDGVLTGLEIVGTDLRGTELVVLSACETALGDIHNGQGVAGLRQAFQLAGAQSVVATLWSIPDQETVQLMNDFFANLSTGQTKADALRNAQLAMIKSRRAANNAAHPYYWAAFTLTGR